MTDSLPEILEQLSEKQRVWWLGPPQVFPDQEVRWASTKRVSEKSKEIKVTDAPADKLISALRTACEALEKIDKDFGTDYADGNVGCAHDAIAEITRVLEGVENVRR